MEENSLVELDRLADRLRELQTEAKALGFHIQDGIHCVPDAMFEALAEREGRKLVRNHDNFRCLTVRKVTFYTHNPDPGDGA